MAVQAVAFDIGGVLERVAPVQDWLDPWRLRLGLDADQLASALARVDPDGGIGTGALTEAAYRRRYADALGLSGAQTDEFMAGMWRWYCGELDQELMAYADDVPENVEAACRSGICGVLHRNTAESIAAIDALLAA